jgi:bifunctional non-homologous end joining protein LigD
MEKVELMLAKSTSVEGIQNDNWSGYWMEPKLDGMRAAVLKVGNEVVIYGRSWLEYQAHVPHLVEAFRAIPLDFHLDGELCFISDFAEVESKQIPVVDFNKTMRIMGSLPEHAIEKQIESGYISFVAFDTINYNESYSYRVESLDGLCRYTMSKFIHRIPVFDNWTVNTYNSLVSNGVEGAMLKNVMSYYKGGRPNKTMYKIKKEETYDVVAYEAYEGTGKHTGRLGGLKFGAYLPDGTFKRVGKAGGGFNDAEREEIWNNQSKYLGRVMEIK